ncbi:unnamed protein product [Polarella glacialis]|uniref:K Homology domain-containing protein n=1 Tax=Polarella glacialis TaxID=89957 RepID=A0A813JMN4_POLGL|nr:unnamed protein product [Polarella glacialis]
MPAIPNLQPRQQPPVLLGKLGHRAELAGGHKYTVRNTFIEAAEEDTLTAPTPVNHRRRNTCPGPEHHVEDMSLCSASAVPSTADDSTSGSPYELREDQHRHHSSQLRANRLHVKNTFIHAPADFSPVAAHRRYRTCSAEYDEDETDGEDGDEVAGLRWSGGGGQLQLSGDASPGRRAGRMAYATEDLQEQLAEGHASFSFMTAGPCPAADDASHSHRGRSRSFIATEDLQDTVAVRGHFFLDAVAAQTQARTQASPGLVQPPPLRSPSGQPQLSGDSSPGRRAGRMAHATEDLQDHQFFLEAVAASKAMQTQARAQASPGLAQPPPLRSPSRQPQAHVPQAHAASMPTYQSRLQPVSAAWPAQLASPYGWPMPPLLPMNFMQHQMAWAAMGAGCPWPVGPPLPPMLQAPMAGCLSPASASCGGVSPVGAGILSSADSSPAASHCPACAFPVGLQACSGLPAAGAAAPYNSPAAAAGAASAQAPYLQLPPQVWSFPGTSPSCPAAAAQTPNWQLPPQAWSFPGTGPARAPGLIEEKQMGMLDLDAEEADEAQRGRLKGGRGPRRPRLWAHIYLHMQLPGFDLVPRLIGRGGCNMRKIADTTGAKVRIRGRGSGHMEIDGKSEAPTPLMVAVTTDRTDPACFKQAIEMIVKELKSVEGRYHAFCQKQGHQHVGHCYSMGLLQPNATDALGSVLKSIPQSGPAKPE